jgi:hypothetical protein
MTPNGNPNKALKDDKVNVKVKLSALWVALLFVYIYVDIFALYKPGVIEDILAGRVWELEITQAWALGSLLLMMVPSLLVFLSMVMKAPVNRWVNIIVAALYIVVGVVTTIGETWVFYMVGHAVGIGLLAVIIWTAWKWPKLDDGEHPDRGGSADGGRAEARTPPVL